MVVGMLCSSAGTRHFFSETNSAYFWRSCSFSSRTSAVPRIGRRGPNYTFSWPLPCYCPNCVLPRDLKEPTVSVAWKTVNGSISKFQTCFLLLPPQSSEPLILGISNISSCFLVCVRTKLSRCGYRMPALLSCRSLSLLLEGSWCGTLSETVTTSYTVASPTQVCCNIVMLYNADTALFRFIVRTMPSSI